MLYKNPFLKASFLLIFLMVACNQKPTQNADSKEEKGPSLAENGGQNTSQKGPETPDSSKTILALEGGKSPALIYGSNPTYVKVEKGEEGWDCKFVEDASLEDPGMVDLSFKIQPKSGIEFTEYNGTNPYGLYFGKIPTKTNIQVCGPESCSIVDHQTMVVIKTSPEQFEKLFTQAKEFKVSEIEAKVWDLYFFDVSLKNFQSNTPAKLNLEKEGTLDWNRVFDQTGVVPFFVDDKPLLELRWILTERPVLVGKYKMDDKEYRVIGIEQFSIEKPQS
ncbi:MAG: hypothetical protein R2877_02540 [Bdellovibrionota bacterium]